MEKINATLHLSLLQKLESDALDYVQIIRTSLESTWEEPVIIKTFSLIASVVEVVPSCLDRKV